MLGTSLLNQKSVQRTGMYRMVSKLLDDSGDLRRGALLLNGAGDGNRTHAICLGSKSSAIELHPRRFDFIGQSDTCCRFLCVAQVAAVETGRKARDAARNGVSLQISSARNRATTRPCASNRRSVRASMLKLVTAASAARKALSCRMPVSQVRAVTTPSVKRRVLRSSA